MIACGYTFLVHNVWNDLDLSLFIKRIVYIKTFLSYNCKIHFIILLKFINHVLILIAAYIFYLTLR